MVNRLVSVGDDFTLPTAVKVADTNLPTRLGTTALNATIASAVVPKLDKTEAATTYATLTQIVPQLSHWNVKLAKSPATAKIVLMGDSTAEASTEAAAIQDRLRLVHMAAGGGLDGMQSANVVMTGHSGAKLGDWLGNSTYTNEVISQAPDLVIVTGGINDVRLGACTEAQLTTIIRNTVNYLRAQLPNADIVLRMPNALLSDDPFGNAFVTPLASAQAYTDILRNAYLAVQGEWPNVVVFNSQDLIFGRIARPKASTDGLMYDTLHPTKGRGYPLIADRLVAGLIGHPSRRALSFGPVDMWQASIAANPYTIGDLVDRADSAASPGIASSGQTWTVWAGTVGVLGKRLYLPTATNSKAVIDSNLADGEFGVTLTVLVPATANQLLIFRGVDTNNYLFVRLTGNNTYEIGKILAGAATVIASNFGPAAANGDRIKVLCEGTAIRVEINDKQAWTGAITDFATATFTGIQASNTTTRFAHSYARRLPVA